jgi:hypothetical protein
MVAEKIDIRSEGRARAQVAIPHTADVIGVARIGADCLRARVRLCIAGSGAAPVTARATVGMIR